MDFKSVLNLAKSNSNGFGSKGYGNTGSGLKKSAAPDVKSYLEKKKLEEQQRAIDAEKRRRELIELRAQAKNSKKARAMSRRTKDNNFMAYLEITSDHVADVTEEIKHKDILKRTVGSERTSSLSKCPPKVVNNAPPREPAPSRTSDKRSSAFNYNDLLNIASNKQHLPTKLPRIPKKKVVDVDIQGRLMTNEEKRKFIEEEARKQGRPLASVNVPKKRTRGPRYRGEENNVVTESLIEKVPPMVKKDARKPATQSKPVLPTQKPISNQQNKIISQQKPAQQPLNRPPRPSVPLAKNGKYNDQNNSKSVNLNKTAATPLTNANIKKSHPVAIKNGIRLPPSNHEQKHPASQNRNSSSLPESRIKKGLPNRVPSTTTNASTKTISTNAQQKIVGKPLPGKVVKNSSVLPNSSRSSQPIPRQPPPPPPSGLRTKTDSNKVIPKQPVPQKSSVPPNPYLQKPSHPNAARQSFPPRGPPTRGPPPRDMTSYRPPPRGSSSYRPPYHPSNRPPMKRRIESEDEYDEDMADFIDDGPAGTDIDYSTHIKEIFGYDRSRYLNEREDDIVESSFAQQMKEEAFSSRYGMLEDLEDIQREQNELEQSRKKKKRLKK